MSKVDVAGMKRMAKDMTERVLCDYALRLFFFNESSLELMVIKYREISYTSFPLRWLFHNLSYWREQSSVTPYIDTTQA